MKLEYRIAKNKKHHYPQVRIKKYLFWSKWKKIDKHHTGYGLYNLSNLDYPKTKKECKKIIKKFDVWFKINIDKKPKLKFIKISKV